MIQSSSRTQHLLLTAFTIITASDINITFHFWIHQLISFYNMLSIAAFCMVHCLDELPQYRSVNTHVTKQSNSLFYHMHSMLSYIDERKFHNNLQLLLAFINSQSLARDVMPVQYDTEWFYVVSSILLAFFNIAQTN